MTNDEIRIAIAEALGWVWYRIPKARGGDREHRCLFLPLFHEYEGQSDAWLVRADGTERICNLEYLWREGMIPDYANDLNAMREAEGQLLVDDNKKDRYLRELLKATGGETLAGWSSVNATARQRAEALLRAIRKWKEAVK